MTRANQSDSDSENLTDYEKQRMKRIEENKARMKAMGLDKMASSFMHSVPIISKKKGKKKVDLEDDEEYKPTDDKDEELSSSSGSDGGDEEDDDELCISRTKPKVKNSTPSRKISKLSGKSDFVDDDDALMKAIALSLQDSSGFLDIAGSSAENAGANASVAENTDRKQTVSKDDSGKRKRKNLFTSRVQMSEDELILHFFQFDEAGKGGINVRDVRRIAASHDFMWTDEEMGNMIRFFDSDGDGKLSLEDFTKIVERCNMRHGSENAGKASLASS